MGSLYFSKVPKCLEDGVLTKPRGFTIQTSDEKRFGASFYFCPKCKQYLSAGEMEKDKRKVALEFIRTFNRSYELSDIVEVNVLGLR